MANPQLVVEIAFGYTWDDTSPSWTDVSTYVREASWTRGRSTEFDTFSAGTATVVLSNQDRRFDPLYSSGAYYGNLKPMVPIRIRAYHNSTYYDRFYGYVDGFPQHYDKGNTDSTVTLRATDAFKLLQSLTVPSAYATRVLEDTPLVYWRLGESSGNVAADISGNRYDGLYSGKVLKGASSVVPFGEDGAAGFNELSGQYVQGPVGCRIDTFPLTVEGWWNAEVPDTNNTRPLVFQLGGTSSSAWNLFIGRDSDTDIYLLALVKNTTSSVDYTKSWVFLDANDGQPHHFMILFTNSVDTCTLWIDGVPATVRGTATGGLSGRTPSDGLMIGAISTSYRTIKGEIDEVALYNATLTSTEAYEHYQVGAYGYAGEVTGTRITRVLDLLGWPAALRDIDTGEVLCGPAEFDNKTALAVLQSIAQTEQGRLFMSADGKITFHAKDRFLTQSTESTAQATFSDDGSDNPYTELSFDYDDTYIYNAASVTRDGGSAQTATNSTSISSYGKRTKSVSGLNLADDRAARAVADYIVFRYADPQLRVQRFSVFPTTTGQWTAVLALKLGYRINMERTPQATGSAIDIDCHLESISESVTPDEWRITMTASPADNASYLKWGTGVWGTEVWR